MRITVLLALLITLVGCAPTPEESSAPAPEISVPVQETMEAAPTDDVDVAEAEVAEAMETEVDDHAGHSHAMEADTESEEPVDHGDTLGQWVRLSYDEAADAAMWDSLSAAGVTDVFVETFYHGFVIYPGSNLFQQYPGLEGSDPLRAAIDEAHARGMKIHCWLQVLKWGVNYREHPEIPISPLMDLASGEDWFCRTIDAGFTNVPYVSPAQLGVQDLAGRLSLDIFIRYPDIDGINLDAIRWPTLGEETDAAAWYDRTNLTTFMMGGHPDPRENPTSDITEAFAQHTREQVTTIVETTNTIIRDLRPSIELSVVIVPTDDEAAAQDWAGWLDNEIIQIATPLCDASDIDGVVEAANAVEAAAAAHAIPVLVGITGNAGSAVEQFEALQGVGVEGAVIGTPSPTDSAASIRQWLEANDL